MLRRMLLKTAAVAALGVAGLTVAGAAQADTVTLRLHHFLPPSAPVPSQVFVPWAEQLAEASDGRLIVEIYPSMQLGGGPPALYDQAREGVVDIAWALPGWTPGRFPMIEVFDLPFIAASAQATSRAAWHFAQEYLAEELADVHALAVHTHGPGVIHIKAPAIESPSDLRGRTLRGPSRLVNRFIEELGATPVGMPVPQMPEALQRGVIDGTVIPWEVTHSLRVPELVDTHTEFAPGVALYTTPFVLAMNREAYDELPDDLRAILDEHSGLGLSNWIGEVMDLNDEPARDVAVERDNRIITIEGESLAAWEEAGMRVRDGWIAEMEAAGIDGAGLVAAVERLVAEEVAAQ
ncbi:MAG: TRAP transporter substrate-binding protein [Pararhodobacter sp.]|nr:TRAP transporter substrate-binding protein [Pararhodobacter sp.]